MDETSSRCVLGVVSLVGSPGILTEGCLKFLSIVVHALCWIETRWDRLIKTNMDTRRCLLPFGGEKAMQPLQEEYEGKKPSCRLKLQARPLFEIYMHFSYSSSAGARRYAVGVAEQTKRTSMETGLKIAEEFGHGTGC
jgi:hypothetical protein